MLQVRVVRRDDLADGVASFVGVRRIHLRQQDTRLAGALVRVVESWRREAHLQDLLALRLRRFQECLDIGVLRLVLVPCLAPCGHCRPGPDQQVEERVHEQNSVWRALLRVEEHCLSLRLVHGVRDQRGLEHRQHVANSLPVQLEVATYRFVWALAEELHHVRATEVVQELWEELVVRLELNRRGVSWEEGTERLGRLDYYSINATEGLLCVQCLVEPINGHPCNDARGGFLIEAGEDRVDVLVVVRAERTRRDSQDALAGRGVGVLRSELDKSVHQRLILCVLQVKYHAEGSVGVERAQLPLVRVPAAYLDVGGVLSRSLERVAGTQYSVYFDVR